MKIFFIGYKNHAKRLLSLLAELNEIEDILVYHPDYAKLEASGIQSLSKKIRLAKSMDVPGVQAAMIASPADSHLEYIQKFLGKSIPVYCEKPPVQSASELTALKNLNASQKSAVYFNFNYRFTALAEFIKNTANADKLGKPLHFNFISAQGMAFKEAFREDRRSKKSSCGMNIFANVGIHYIDLCQYLLRERPKLLVRHSKHSPYSESQDTSSVHLGFRECTGHILVSYAAPFLNTAELVFENAVLRLDNGSLKIFTPRDSFDKAGRFTTAPVTELCRFENSLGYYDESLKKSLRYFVERVRSGQLFSAEEFDLSVASNELVLHAGAD